MFFNKESIDFLIFSISYTVSQLIKNIKHEKKIILQKISYSIKYHLFFNQLHVILFFFRWRKNFKKVYSSSSNCSKDTWRKGFCALVSIDIRNAFNTVR